MSRATHRENFRVEVEPDTARVYWFKRTPEELERKIQGLCEDLVAQIRRHVDNLGSINVRWDDEHTCSHCGYAWTEQSTTYNGGCCDEDEKNNPNPEPQP